MQAKLPGYVPVLAIDLAHHSDSIFGNSDEAVARGEKASGWAMPYIRYTAAHASRTSTMAPTPPISRRQPTRIGKCFIAAAKAMAKISGGKVFVTQAVIAPCCSREVMPSGAKLSGTTR